jgi:uncharacterized protein (DUF362 family)
MEKVPKVYVYGCVLVRGQLIGGLMMKKKHGVLLLGLVVLVLVTLDVYDVTALKDEGPKTLFYPLNEIKRDPPWETTDVAVVRTNTEGMPNPVDPDKLGNRITEKQIEDMVRLAIDMTGGIESVIDPDDKLILIKPNWVEIDKPGTGTITDYRVVMALAKVIYDSFPDVEIVVADGPAVWIDRSFAHYRHDNATVSNAFETTGYAEMIRKLDKDPVYKDMNIRLADLNVPMEDMVEVEVPGGGWYQSKYYTHRLVVEADKFISVPVMKMHAVRVSMGLKGNIGIAPGLIYGWAKGNLDHSPAYISKVVVDLSSIAQIDYVLVDGTACLELAWIKRVGSTVYRNMVVAGKDVVAVDSVAARLMGFNPEDIAYITMAGLSGLGLYDLDKINILGETIESAAYLFAKNKGDADWLGRSTEGQTFRFWTLYGSNEKLTGTEVPTPGEDGWTEVLYASDDFINISKGLDSPKRFTYAFTKFYAPRDEKVHLRVGSSMAMRLWIDGELVYEYDRSRQHVLPNDKLLFDMTEGEHTLLVETASGTTFSVYIAELVPAQVPQPKYRHLYEGTRIHGLKNYL